MRPHAPITRNPKPYRSRAELLERLTSDRLSLALNRRPITGPAPPVAASATQLLSQRRGTPRLNTHEYSANRQMVCL